MICNSLTLAKCREDDTLHFNFYFDASGGPVNTAILWGLVGTFFI